MGKRLDQVVVERGLAATRSRARDLILRGLVQVDGAVETKPARVVVSECAVIVDGAAAAWVSRGAEKLVAALDAFGFDPSGRRCLDVGSSTGGFTQVLLNRGAAHVTAVDVGRDQLHDSLVADLRVTRLEQTDARALDRALVPDRIAAVTADVSFVSLTKVLPAALALAEPDSWLVALVKPQFEVGPALVGKGGIVRDGEARLAALRTIERFLTDSGWQVAGSLPSPIAGGDGNIEFLIGALRHG